MFKSIVAGLIVCLGMGVTVVSACDTHSLNVSEATIKLPPVNAHNAAAYMQITNPTDAPMTIVAIKTDIAEKNELHESRVIDGVASMQEIHKLVIESKSTVSLAPGGLHIMLIGLKDPIKAGQSIPVTLEFESGKNVVISAIVK